MIGRFLPLNRLLRLGAVATVSTLVLASSAVAAPQFQSQFEGTTANAFFFQRTPPVSVNVFVSRGPSEFQATLPDGSESSFVRDGTFLSLFIRAGNRFGFGCFELDPAQFTGSAINSPVTLNATVGPGSKMCPGVRTRSVGVESQVDAEGVVAEAMSDGITVMLTWTPPGPKTIFQDSNSFTCGDFSFASESQGTFFNAAPTGSITALGQQFKAFLFGRVEDAQRQFGSEGIASRACFGRF